MPRCGRWRADNACCLLGACAAQAARCLQGDPHSVAAEGLKFIRELYDVERGITCHPVYDRRKARKLSRLRALDRHTLLLQSG